MCSFCPRGGRGTKGSREEGGGRKREFTYSLRVVGPRRRRALLGLVLALLLSRLLQSVGGAAPVVDEE